MLNQNNCYFLFILHRYYYIINAKNYCNYFFATPCFSVFLAQAQPW